MGIFDGIIDWFENLGKEEVDKNKEQDLINKLAGMEVNERNEIDKILDEVAEASRPSDKEFEYLPEYNPIDDETLQETSKNKYYNDYYQAGVDVKNKYDSQISSIEEDEKEMSEKYNNKSDKYTEKYNDIISDFKDSAVKSGIADSSIMSNGTQSLEKEKQATISDIEKELQKYLEKTSNKKNQLKSGVDSQLDTLKFNYNKDVNDYFNQLQKAEQDKVENVKKENEKIAKEEKDYKIYQDKVVDDKRESLEKEKEKFFEKEEQFGYTGDRLEEYENRYKLAKDFYSNYKKGSAVASIENNNSLKSFLGAYYYRLLEDIKNG